MTFVATLSLSFNNYFSLLHHYFVRFRAYNSGVYAAGQGL